MTIVENGIVPSKDVAKDGDYEEYELKEAVDCLARAEEIKKDDRLMKAIQPLLDKRARAYMTLSELRQHASKVRMQEEKDAASKKAMDAELDSEED